MTVRVPAERNAHLTWNALVNSSARCQGCWGLHVEESGPCRERTVRRFT
jgi:hypothetical protein